MGEVRFGGYRLKRLLGKGGMGQVWLAYDTAATRWVALKLLPAELATAGGYRHRFEREAEAVAALRDPHVPRIHRFGEIDGRLYIDMQFIEGTDLARTLSAEGAMAPDAAVGIVAHVAAALDVAHRAGLVHRDVKPSNIVVHPTGFAYLIDFGIAHGLDQTAVTTTGMAIGTLAYMAPERFTGRVDARADVYSLACVLYECVTGARPYGDTDPARQMHAHLMTAPPRASSACAAVPDALDAVIARGLAKHPDERFRTAGEFAAAARTAIGAAVRPAQAATVAPSAAAASPIAQVPESSRPATKFLTAAPVEPASGHAPGRQAPPPGPAPTRQLSESNCSPGQFADDRDAPTPSPTAGEQCTDDPADVSNAGPPGGRPTKRLTDADAAARREPPPTKVLPEPGPTPTLVATKLEVSPIAPYPYPAAGVGVSGSAVPFAGQRGDRQLPVARSAPPGPLYPVAGRRVPETSGKRYAYGSSYPAARRQPGTPPRPGGWRARLVALQARVRSPKRGPATLSTASRAQPARRVFPVPVDRPAYQPVPRTRRPLVPVLRPRPRRRRSMLSTVIGALVVLFLAPFALAAGCFAVIAVGIRTGDSGSGVPSLPPGVQADERPGPPQPPPAAAVDTPVRDGKFEFVVTRVDAGVSRVGLQRATGSFLIATVVVRNISEEVKWFLPLGQRLFDVQGARFDHNATAGMWQNAQQRLGYSFELRPGQSATTQLVFDLPPNTSPDRLELHDFVLSNGVQVQLG